jgi:hypothetical protein
VGPALEWLSDSGRRAALGGALGLTLLAAPAAGVLFIANSHRDASGWSRATLAALPSGARLVTPWIAYAPLRAEQTQAGVRRDVRLELTATGVIETLDGLRGGYAVVVTDVPPASGAAVEVGPVAGASFKGLSGLGAGPFKIGYGSVKARTYRLPD